MASIFADGSFSDRTKLAPSQILFGNALDLDRGIFVPTREHVEGGQPLSEYMAKLLALQESLVLIARVARYYEHIGRTNSSIHRFTLHIVASRYYHDCTCMFILIIQIIYVI